MANAADMQALVQRLRSDSREARLRAAAELVDRLKGVDAAPRAFVAAGGIGAAVHLARSGSPDAQFVATRLLMYALIGDAGAAWALVAAGGVPQLVAQLRSEDWLLQSSTLLALTHAKGRDCPQFWSDIEEAGAVPLAVRLLRRRSSSSRLPGEAAQLLGQLARSSPSMGAAVAASGAVQAAVQQLRNAQDSQAVLDGLATLASLAGSAPCMKAAAAAGAAAAAVQVLRSGSPEAIQPAAKLIGTVVHTHPHAMPAFNAAGGVAALEAAWRGSSGNAQQYIADALTQLRQADHGPQQQTAGTTAAGQGLQHARAGAAAGRVTATVSAQAASRPTQLGAAQPAHPPRVCAAPGCDATSGLKRCGACRAVRYCSVQCQQTHWPAHIAECRRIQAARVAAAAAVRASP